MDLERMNRIASTASLLPIKRIEDLQNHVEYHITKIRPSHTKWGLKIVAEVDRDYIIYLPPRVSETLIENKVELEQYQETAAAGRLYITFQDVDKKLFKFALK